MSTPTPTENVAPTSRNIVSVSGVISQNLQPGEQRNNIPKSVSQGSNASKASFTGASEKTNSFKEMTDRIKKLQMAGDSLAERICQLHAEVASLLLRASVLFDPQVVRLMDCQAEIPGEFEDAADANLREPQWREELDESYGKMLDEVNEGELQVEMEVDE